MSVRESYVAVHRQGWLPIFVRDAFDAVFLADVCAAAGLPVIEITCRRPGVVEEIRRIRKRHPGLCILVGSTVDSDAMVRFLRRRIEGFPTLAELADLGVDGFVSRLPFADETIERYRRTHLLIPAAESAAEAYLLVAKGAHFAKFYAAWMFGGPAYVRTATAAPTHGLLPILVTGGVTKETILPYLEAGAALLGGGFDMMLGENYTRQQQEPCRDGLICVVASYRDAVAAGRERVAPELARAVTDADYVAAITHYHSFRGDETDAG